MLMNKVVLDANRPGVGRSWARSRMCGLDEGVVPHLPFQAEVDPVGTFARASTTVLDGLGAMLEDSQTAAVLLDSGGLFLTSRCSDGALRSRMEDGQSAPGFIWAEEYAGTSAVGIALEERVPAWTTGSEHYLEMLRDLTCAAAPVFNPFTHKLEGVVDITALKPISSPLMLPIVMQAARAIEERMFEIGSIAERTLLARFMSAKRRPGNVVMVRGERTDVSTSNAAFFLTGSDKSLLTQRAEDVMSAEPVVDRITLASGNQAIARFETIMNAGHRIGTLVELTIDRASSRTGGSEAATRLRATGSESAMVGRSQATRFLRAKVEQLSGSTFPLVISGDSGVGKLTLARMLATDGVALIDCGRANADSEPSLLREVEGLASRHDHSLILRDIGALSASGMQRLGGLAEAAEANGSRLICTYTDRKSTEPSIQPAFGVRVHVPALRERPEDLLDLVPRLFGRRGITLRLAAPVMQMLMRYDWPGNVRELDSVLTAMAKSARGKEITLVDVPFHYQRGSRRLRRIEHIERNAIIQALLESEGNKTKAAEVLEIGRATLYRKIRVYGLESEMISN